MLAQRNLDAAEIPVVGQLELHSLLHQLFSVLLRLLQGDWEVVLHIIHDFVPQLHRQKLNQFLHLGGTRKLMSRPKGFFSPPIVALRRNVCCADNAIMRVNEEERKDFPVTRFRGIFEFEGLHLVLQDIRESEQPPLLGDDAPEVLDGVAVLPEPVHLVKPVVVLLFVAHIIVVKVV